MQSRIPNCNNKLGLSNICEVKMNVHEYWSIYRNVNGKVKRYFFNKKKYTLDEVIETRNKLFNL